MRVCLCRYFYLYFTMLKYHGYHKTWTKLHILRRVILKIVRVRGSCLILLDWFVTPWNVRPLLETTTLLLSQADYWLGSLDSWGLQGLGREARASSTCNGPSVYCVDYFSWMYVQLWPIFPQNYWWITWSGVSCNEGDVMVYTHPGRVFGWAHLWRSSLLSQPPWVPGSWVQGPVNGLIILSSRSF